ncbi:hypothetical protein DL98DRAFT_653729 [Cadophora sp. DSE1049]|nr:hypothetical protein DL98DRAFT_653729 [Cadophora sp. DSE1049]
MSKPTVTHFESNVYLLGHQSVAKFPLIHNYTHPTPDVYDPTLEDYTFKIFTFNNIAQRLWLLSSDYPFDISGQIAEQSIRSADGIVMVYDVCSLASFEAVKPLYEQIQAWNGETGTAKRRAIVLLGLKPDGFTEHDDNPTPTSLKREVSFSTGQDLAQSMKCKFFEIPVTKDQGSEELFLYLAGEIHEMNYEGLVREDEERRMREERERRRVEGLERNKRIERMLGREKGRFGVLWRCWYKVVWWWVGGDESLRFEKVADIEKWRIKGSGRIEEFRVQEIEDCVVVNGKKKDTEVDGGMV